MHSRDAKLSFDELAALLANAAALGRRHLPELLDLSCKAGDIVGRDERNKVCVARNFAVRRNIRKDDRAAAGHCRRQSGNVEFSTGDSG